MIAFAFRPGRRCLILASIAALILTLYLWQVVSLWRDQDTLALTQNTRIIWQGTGVRLNKLTGTVVVTGASATLHAHGRADTGELYVENLPILPPTQTYKLWCVDATGTIDAGADFSVPFDSDGTFGVGVITPQFLTSYTRFFITIESVDIDSPTPSTRVVVTN